MAPDAPHTCTRPSGSSSADAVATETADSPETPRTTTAEEALSPPVTELPLDVLSLVLGSTILDVRLVDRSFRDAADGGRRTLCLRGPPGSDQDSNHRVVALLRRLPQLQELDYSLCTSSDSAFLSAVPSSLTALSVAPTHDLSGDPSQPLARITALQSISLARSCSDNIRHLSSSGRLTCVDLSDCVCVHDIAPLRALTALRSLTLDNCWQFNSLDALARCTSLSELRFSGCILHRHMSQIAAFAPHLAVLRLADAFTDRGGAVSLDPLTRLTALRFLDLSVSARHTSAWQASQQLLLHAAHLETLAPLAALPSLVSVNASGRDFRGDDSLTTLTAVTRLQSLRMDGCTPVEACIAMSLLWFLPSLETSQPAVGTRLTSRLLLLRLPVDDDSSPSDVCWPAAATALLSLQLGNSQGNTAFAPPLLACSSLTALHLPFCVSLTTAAPLLTHPSLTVLNLQGCQEVEDLDLLPSASSLQHLSLLHCRRVAHIGPLADCAALEVLDLRGTRVACLAPLGACLRLHRLQVDGRYIPHKEVEHLLAASAVAVEEGRWVPE